MRVDFYQLTRDPAEHVIPALAEKTLASGERFAVIVSDDLLRDTISDQLWTRKPDSFLAHDTLGGEHDSDQPILLLSSIPDEPAKPLPNRASFLAIADGKWRSDLLEKAYGLARIFYLFPPDSLDEARQSWTSLKNREGVTRHYWKQEGRRWIEAA